MRKPLREPWADEAHREGLAAATVLGSPWREKTKIPTHETFAARTRNISNIDAAQHRVLKEFP